VREHWCDGNSVDLLINGEAFFPRVFESIRNARREVLLETFIIWDDEVGQQLQQALIAAAQRGVRVDVTMDAYGSADLSEEFLVAMADAGVHLHRFEPTHRLLSLRLNVFRRLHRKLVVIDSELAFIGGINYSGDHLTSFGPEAKQDYAVEVRGPVVADIHQTCADLLLNAEYKRRYFWQRRHAKPTTAAPAGKVRAQLVVRDNHRYKRAIEKHYLRAIHSARERLILAHAYFFPSYSLLHALRNAARRGVKVTLILQGQPDMPWVRLCSQMLYGYLMREGVKIYEYKQRAFHGKLAVADDRWVTVGSSNLDPLSLSLNLEANLIIDDAGFNQQVRSHLRALAQLHCEPVSMQVVRRSYWWRMPLIFLSFHFLRHFPAIAGWLPAHAPELELVHPPKNLWMKKDVYDQERV
jgi:cardiolipin synthase